MKILPIIIMTSHYQGRPELAIDVLRHNGATDFIEKPFPENGKTLEVTIQEALFVWRC
jgi:FixJ family two-component response regulator